MLSQSTTFIEIDPFMRMWGIYGLFSMFICLVGASILTYQDIKSHRRQGKRWIWHKRPSSIAILIVLIVSIGGFLLFAPIATVSSTDIDHLPPSSKGLRVLIAMIGASIALIGGGSLALYRQSLIEKEKKEEQSPQTEPDFERLYKKEKQGDVDGKQEI